MGDRSAPLAPQTLVLATATTPREATEPGYEGPRADYLELQRLRPIDVLDYAVYPRGPLGRVLLGLEKRARCDWYLALVGLRRGASYRTVLAMSERVGTPLAVLARLSGRRRRLVCTFTSWSPRQEAAITRLGLFAAMDAIIVHCRGLRTHLEALGAPADRIHVVPYGVDHRFFSPRPHDPAAPIALSLGECRNRDYATLARATAALPFPVRLLPFGYRQSRAQAPDAGLFETEGLRLGPAADAVALREIYARARFVVVPLRDVPHSAGATSVLEAMSMARAVIVSRSRGIADYVVDGETALVVDAGDAGALRAAMVRLWNDPAEAARLGANARRRVDAELNRERHVQGVVAVVDRLHG